MIERNIFGIDREEPILQTEGSHVAPQEQFSGTLTGIVASSDPERHVVIITVNSEVFVLPINTTREGYTLRSVDGESAIVEFGGREYNLILDSSVTAPQVASSGAPTGSAAARRAQARQQEQPPQPATESETLNVTLERGELVNQLGDINAVLRSLLVSPTYVDGDFQGYRVTRMNNDSPMRALGLQQGDIINRINGEELTSPEILFGMLGRVDSLNAVSVDITRNGEKRTLFVEIQ
jgi:general secretion pathway protein C